MIASATFSDDLRKFIEATMSIFAIVNPIGSLPFIVSLTEGATPPQRQRLVRIAGLTAVAIVCAIALGGNFLLHNVFQVDVSEFAIGGGLLLIIVGVRAILSDDKTKGRAPIGDDERVMLAVSPIACPLLVGPGAIVTTMLLVNQYGQFYALGACLAAFVFVILILNYSHLLLRLLGPIVTLAVGRVMDIFIVAIGVRFVVRASMELFPFLTK